MARERERERQRERKREWRKEKEINPLKALMFLLNGRKCKNCKLIFAQPFAIVPFCKHLRKEVKEASFVLSFGYF